MPIENKIISTSTELEVAFFDVDPMNIVWHGNYFKYLEISRCALLNEINYDYIEMKASGFSWPIIDTRLKYVKPLKFKQKFIVQATLAESDVRLKINYLITDKITGERLSKGHSTQVAIDMKTNEMCFASPSILIEKINDYLNRSAQ